MNSFRGRSILTPFMMIMIILVWKDYPLAGKTKNEGERKKKKGLSKLEFRCNKSIKQSASVSRSCFHLIAPAARKLLLFSRCHGGHENETLILCQAWLKQKDVFVGCCGTFQALLSFLLHMGRQIPVATGTRMRKGEIETMSSSAECQKFGVVTNARKESDVYTI